MEPGNQGAGEHILKGRHVIGLFFLMMLLSAAFFTLGYVMGRNQYDDHVYAISNHIPNEPTPPDSDWEFYHAVEKKPGDDYLRESPERTVSQKTTPEAMPTEKSATNPPQLSKTAEIAKKSLKKVGFKAKRS